MAGLELVDRTLGEPRREPVVHAEIDRDRAIRMAEVATALGDPFGLLVESQCTRAGTACFCADDPIVVDS